LWLDDVVEEEEEDSNDLKGGPFDSSRCPNKLIRDQKSEMNFIL